MTAPTTANILNTWEQTAQSESWLVADACSIAELKIRDELWVNACKHLSDHEKDQARKFGVPWTNVNRYRLSSMSFDRRVVCAIHQVCGRHTGSGEFDSSMTSRVKAVFNAFGLMATRHKFGHGWQYAFIREPSVDAEAWQALTYVRAAAAAAGIRGIGMPRDGRHIQEEGGVWQFEGIVRFDGCDMGRAEEFQGLVMQTGLFTKCIGAGISPEKGTSFKLKRILN